MTNRKAIINEYKEQRLRGGVYKINNLVNGKYLLGSVVNLNSIQNRFQFAMTTGSTIEPRLQKDWKELGPQAFALEILEELQQGPDQSRAAFQEDLKELEQPYRANLDASKSY